MQIARWLACIFFNQKYSVTPFICKNHFARIKTRFYLGGENEIFLSFLWFNPLKSCFYQF